MNSITGVEELKKILDNIANVPARVLDKAVMAGSSIVENIARQNAPEKHGNLKRGIVSVAEIRKSGKKVYQVKFIGDFVKFSRDGKRSFYPASQEYGWNKKEGGRVQGKYFLKKAIQQNRVSIEQTIVDTLANSLKELE